MIAYFDTSALMPLVIDEPGSAVCRRVWNDAERAVCTSLGLVETHAALAQAHRMHRVDDAGLERARSTLVALWDQVDTLTPDTRILERAASLAYEYGLRGYDAVHCASAVELLDGDLVGVSGDHTLLAAWQALGLATADTSR
jgi:predicted nucleic acid-binding protein